MCKCGSRSAFLLAVGVGSLVLLAGRPAEASLRHESPSQPIVPSIRNVRLVGHLGGHPHALSVQGMWAYLGMGWEFAVLDLSDRAHPHRTGYLMLPGAIRAIDVAGGYAYVVDSDGGMRVIDVSNPGKPVEIGFYPAYNASAVAVREDYAYVATNRGLQVVDVAHPDAPATLGIYRTLEIPLDVAAAGTSLYVADAKRGMHVIDASNPAMPVHTGFVAAGIEAVAATEGYVYGVGADFWVIDVSNVPSPTIVGETSTFGYDVVVAGDYAYVAGLNGGLRIVDVSQPTAPAEVSSCADVYASRVAFAGDHAFVTAGRQGIHAIDVSDPLTPTLVATFHAPGDAFHLQALGHYLYVTWIDWARGGRGMTIFDVSDPASPVLLDSAALQQEPEGITVQGALVYVTTGGLLPAGVQVFDVSNPHHVVHVGAYDALYGAEGVAAIGDHVAVAGEGGGLYILRFQSHPAFLPFVIRQHVSNERQGQ